MTDHRSRAKSGQILVAFVIAIIAIIAMVSLVIEGGNLFAQQRIAQNTADSTANAGTIAIAAVNFSRTAPRLFALRTASSVTFHGTFVTVIVTGTGPTFWSTRKFTPVCW